MVARRERTRCGGLPIGLHGHCRLQWSRRRNLRQTATNDEARRRYLGRRLTESSRLNAVWMPEKCGRPLFFGAFSGRRETSDHRRGHKTAFFFQRSGHSPAEPVPVSEAKREVWGDSPGPGTFRCQQYRATGLRCVTLPRADLTAFVKGPGYSPNSSRRWCWWHQSSWW